MERLWIVFCLLALYLQSSNAFILPLKTPDGTLNLEHLVGHMTLLEQTVTTLQQTVTSQNADIAALKTEIANMKSTQQRADTKLVDLQKQIQTGQITAILSLKDDINSVKNTITLVSNKAISLSSKLTNLTRNYQALSSQVNSTGVTRDADLKALNQKYQTLSSQVNSTGVTRDAELKALDQKYQTLSSQVNSTGVTRDAELKALDQKYQTLSSQVNSTGATRDAELKILDQKYQTLSNATTMTISLMSAKIAQLNTEVGFESWMGSSTVPITSNSIVKFSDIQYNVGGGYNASTGVFIAPVSGTYLFWTQIETIKGAQLDLLIYKGNSQNGYFRTNSDGQDTGTVITAARVTVGERVYVTTRYTDKIDLKDHCRFGGTLLYRH